MGHGRWIDYDKGLLTGNNIKVSMRKSPAEKIVWMKLNIEPGTRGRLVPAEQPPEGAPLGSSVWAWLWTRGLQTPGSWQERTLTPWTHQSTECWSDYNSVTVTHCNSLLFLSWPEFGSRADALDHGSPRISGSFGGGSRRTEMLYHSFCACGHVDVKQSAGK